jgi:high-affinity Fe2+/Pb2+ permease
MTVSKASPASSLQVRYNMETVLIVLVVLFLLGGGGWGYSRWRG